MVMFSQVCVILLGGGEFRSVVYGLGHKIHGLGLPGQRLAVCVLGGQVQGLVGGRGRSVHGLGRPGPRFQVGGIRTWAVVNVTS